MGENISNFISCYNDTSAITDISAIISNCYTTNSINTMIVGSKEETMDYSRDTKTVLDDQGGYLKVMKVTDGHSGVAATIMPSIVDVTIFNDEDGNPCATRVDFADGTYTKAARRNDDEYCVEFGISICITKKLLDIATNGVGDQIYNKLMRRACKVMKDNREAEAKIEEALEAEIRRYNHLVEKRKKRDERRAAAIREDMIEVQKEAYLRALKEFNQEK